MAAKIRITLLDAPGGNPVGAVTEQISRDDLRKGQQVVCYSIDNSTTYAWTLAFTPKSPGGAGDPLVGLASAASLLAPDGSATRTAKFNIDHEGDYLIRLVTNAGISGQEDVQFLRLRQLTRFGNLRLSAAGERNDQNGKVPIDAPTNGWSDDANMTLQRLMLFARRTATTGRTLWVDANRGRNDANNSEDQTILVDLPGPDATALVETGMKTKAEGHGDFPSITAAIAYANNAVARGEPAASQTNPWTIFIQPGLYIEDLVLRPFIHLVGLGTPPRLQDEIGTGWHHPVLIRTAATCTTFAGTAATGDQVMLSNLAFENVIVSTRGVIEHTGGTLVLDKCVVWQRSNDAAQGPAIKVVSVLNAPMPRTVLRDCTIASLGAGVTQWVILHDAPSGDLLASRTAILGAGGGLKYNPSGYGGGGHDGVLNLANCEVRGRASYAVWAYGTTNILDRCIIGADAGVTRSAIFDGFGLGANAKIGNLLVQLSHCTVEGNFTVDISVNSAANGATRKVMFEGTTVKGQFLLPNGSSTTLTAGDKAQSLQYEPTHVNPTSLVAVLANNQALAATNVQDAIDSLILMLLPNGVPPGLILDDAYDGIAAISPYSRGHGLGRTIIANYGAVQITKLNPSGDNPSEPTLLGGLKVEGRIDIGGLQTDGLGSEITLNPNPYGAGPAINLGRATWPADVGTGLRGITSATIQAKQTAAPKANHLRLRTGDGSVSGVATLGQTILEAGSSIRPSGNAAAGPNAGSVHILAGSYTNPTAGGLAGDVILVPGEGTSPAVGSIFIARHASGTQATLTAAGVFVGNVTGSIWFATPGGEVQIDILNTDNSAAVQTKISKTGVLVGSANGNNLQILTSDRGPDADVLYVRDSTGGTLNTALGELRIGSGANYAAGAFGDKVGLTCTADKVLTVAGDIVLVSPNKATATGTVNTNNATGDFSVIAFATTASTAYLLEASVVLNNITDGTVRILRVSQAAYRNGANALTVDATVNVLFSSGDAALAAAAVAFVVTGLTFTLQATSVINKSIHWRADAIATSVS